MAETEERPLEPGMLLLGGLQGVAGEPLDSIWTVKSAGKRSATIIKHSERVSATASLRTNSLPPGWRILNNRALAQLAREASEDQ